MKAKEKLWVGDMLVDDGGYCRAAFDDAGTWWLSEDAPNYQAPADGFVVLIAAANYEVGDEVVVYDEHTTFAAPTQTIEGMT